MKFGEDITHYEHWHELSAGQRAQLQDDLYAHGYELVFGDGQAVGQGAQTLQQDGTWTLTKDPNRPAREGMRLARRKIPGHPIWNVPQAPQAQQNAQPAQQSPLSAGNEERGEIMADSFGSKIASAMVAGAKAQISQKAIDICRRALVAKLSESNPSIAGLLNTPEAQATLALLVPIAFMAAHHYSPNNTIAAQAAGLMEPGLAVGAAMATDVVLERVVAPMATALLSSGILAELGTGTPTE